MKTTKDMRGRGNSVQVFSDPPVAQALFGDVRLSWIWLILRIYVGWEWLTAGWGKLHNAAWTGAKAGTALSGFINGALSKATGEHPMSRVGMQGFYRTLSFRTLVFGVM